ncbi:glycosyltransferase [Thioclava sp. DLFJ4-1]|uniref:glycosyltransferase n=1 Tax=Thioclava sp. DLFJ4-1 TaxID=1915313 RepID=UPI00117D4BC4|nr:glycosyltransferase [Thioclava sp. DLFJ4-1]
MEDGIIYFRTTLGHKSSYADTLTWLTRFEIRQAKRSLSLIFDLVASRQVIFSTLDDDYLLFFLISALRRLAAKSTIGLFLRPQTCFGTKRPIQIVKRTAFRIIRSLKIADVLVIVPFEVAPHYAEIASDWVHDPEFWDLDIKVGGPNLPSTPLAENIVISANGRKVICLPGTVLRRKGLSMITRILETDRDAASRILFVCAGRVPEAEQEEVDRLEMLGGLVIPRMISDQELFSLYRVADIIWAAYAPEYDQSSGIFGRALQTGCPVAVRHGSLLERMALSEKVPYVSIDFNAPEVALKALNSALAKESLATRQVDIAGNLARRQRFVEKITPNRKAERK